MAANRTTFEKLQRDRAKKAKAEAKRAKRMGNDEGPVSHGEEDVERSEWDLGESGEPLSAAELLTLVEQLQREFDAKAISFEEYEERKADLLSRLPID
jgi:hypothetical protein